LFLTAAHDEGEWSASCPGGFTPGKRASHCPLTVAGRPPELVSTLLDKGYISIFFFIGIEPQFLGCAAEA